MFNYIFLNCIVMAENDDVKNKFTDLTEVTGVIAIIDDVFQLK